MMTPYITAGRVAAGIAAALVLLATGCAAHPETEPAAVAAETVPPTADAEMPAPALSPTAAAAAPESAPSTIRLTVTGESASALIRDVVVTEDTGDANEATTVRSLPWSTEVTLTEGEMERLVKVVVFAKNADGTPGNLACEISVNGERVASEQTSGYRPVTCLDIASH